MYVSIFDRINNYKSNPIDEYFKISKFVDEIYCYGVNTVFDVLDDCFSYSPELSSIYIDLENCIDDNVYLLRQYKDSPPAKSYFDHLNKETKTQLLYEYLSYVQIICNLINVSIKIEKSLASNNTIKHLKNLIATSLKSLNYKAVIRDDKIDIMKEDYLSEVVANQSPSNISEAIIGFLCSKGTKEKERSLQELVDLLEPILKKYSSQSIVSKIKQYVQVVRHPEEKKKEKEFEWYYSDKEKYIDELFGLCIFVQQYDNSKKALDEIELKQ